MAAVGAAVTGYAATRPIDHDDAVRIAALIADPAAHQSCAGVDVPICTYDGDGALVGSFAPHVAAVLAGAPPGAVPDGVLLRQGADVDRAVLDPHVAALLPADPPADGVLPVALTHNDDAHEAARFWVALAVIGVRDDHQAGEVVDLRGQARGVVALWLATRDLPGDRAHDMSSVSPAGGPEHAWEAARPWPDVDVAGPIPVVWALTDLEAARRLIAAPEAELRSALHAGWSELTDPGTSTDDLLAVLGLAGRAAAGQHAPLLAVSAARRFPLVVPLVRAMPWPATAVLLALGVLPAAVTAARGGNDLGGAVVAWRSSRARWSPTRPTSRPGRCSARRRWRRAGGRWCASRCSSAPWRGRPWSWRRSGGPRPAALDHLDARLAEATATGALSLAVAGLEQRRDGGAPRWRRSCPDRWRC